MVILGAILSEFQIATPQWLALVGGCLLITFACWRAFQDERRIRLALESRIKGLEDGGLVIQKTPLNPPNLKFDIRFDQLTGFSMMGANALKPWATAHCFTVGVTNIGGSVSIEEVSVSCDGHHARRAFLNHERGAVLPQILETNKTFIFHYRLPPGKFVEFINLKPRLQVKTSCGKEFTVEDDVFKNMKTVSGSLWEHVIIHQTRRDGLPSHLCAHCPLATSVDFSFQTQQRPGTKPPPARF